MKAKKPILFPLKKLHGEFEVESSMRGSAHKIQKTRNLHNVLLNENFIQYVPHMLKTPRTPYYYYPSPMMRSVSRQKLVKDSLLDWQRGHLPLPGRHLPLLKTPGPSP